ncbi:MAG TPA: hypothetical protein VOB72_13070 [Candidatus Dormibacteraeota bacterium]|nr:hypothetical protein [Candidatus Dormibacteraeota bacterium]
MLGRRVVIAFAAVAAVAACGMGPSAGLPSGARHDATPSPAAAPSPAPLSEWRKRGATEVPPADLQAISLEGIQVVNETKSAVADADAHAWAGAVLRAINFEQWAVSRQQDQFLLQSGLSSAPRTVFQPDLVDIDKARKANSRVEYTHKVFRRMVLRPVPDALRTTFAQQLAVWKPYAFYLDAVGPATKLLTDASGRQTTQTVLAAGAPGNELVGGELVHDALMGDVFAFASDWDCVAPASRQKLAPLCNP